MRDNKSLCEMKRDEIEISKFQFIVLVLATNKSPKLGMNSNVFKFLS